MADKGTEKYDRKDAARDTGVGTRHVTRAWHAARDDAASSGYLEERNSNKASDSESGGFLGFLFSLAGFGKKDE